MPPRHREARADLRTAGHELRTQLQALVALADTAPRRGAWSAQLRGCAAALLEIAEDWLGRGNDAVDFEPAAVARSVAAALAPWARRKGIGLGCVVRAGCPARIRGDRRAFRALLGNLVGNALKFTAEGRVVVRLSGTRVGVIARLRIEVDDSGPGLPHGDLRALATSSRRKGGTGLGLAIASDSARRLGGELTAEPSPLGGARLVADLALPLGHKVREAEHRATQAEVRLRVLVAEDHPLNRELAREHLERRGHRVCCARDGREALRLARRGTFDIALVDLRLPDMSGERLAASLLESHPSLPILAWSGETTLPGKARFAGLLCKPCAGVAIAQAAETAARSEDDGRILARRILLRRRREECARINQARRSGSGARISEEAHRAGGALAMAGLPVLAALARRAQQEAEAGRVRAAGRMLGKLSDGLRRLGDGLA